MLKGWPELDLWLWGKQKGLPSPYPVVCHLLDAVAGVEELWDTYLAAGTRNALASGLGVSEKQARSVLAYWAGLHDICKIMPCFQSRYDPAFQKLWNYPAPIGEFKPHAYAIHVWLGHILAEAGYPARNSRASAFRVAQLLGGHHGTFHSYDSRQMRNPLAYLPELGLGRWDEQRRAVAAAVHELAGRPEPPETVPAPVAALACGLVILADWLVSQDHFLRAQLTHGLPRQGDRDSLARHLADTRAAMPAVLREAGLIRPAFAAGGFRDDFPQIEEPNGLQRSISEHLPGLLEGGAGLLMVMAPMGEGKTEIALHAAKLMGEAAGTPGFNFGLPTMATTDQMFRRVNEFRLRRARGTITLLHGMAWLDDWAYSPAGNAVEVLTDDPFATQWLRGAKRGLLAGLSVATIDQALLAVLRGRHNVLRMLGLVGKVLVVDEVHAYDAYMQGLLKRLVSWLGAMKVPVVLLSATLPVAVGRRLAEAYLNGAGVGTPVPEVRYPGWIYVSPTAAISTPVQVRERSLALASGNVPIRADGRPDRREAIGEVLSALPVEGGCAAIVCNTVAEAQQTYLDLADRFARDGSVRLALLHSRFPAYRREEITREVVSWFGKEAGRGRPGRAILVATQVIEQSLDLDFDIMISDLAPVALLLQRAGRCHRHPVNDARRPAWARDMRLVVLSPVDGTGKFTIPKAWPFVYHRSLLCRTHQALVGVHRIDIPGEIQQLVDEVYDEEFTDQSKVFTDEDLDRIAEEQTRDMYAAMATIPEPSALHDLVDLSKGEIVDEYSTRLGADSGRVVCCFRDSGGVLRLPGSGALLPLTPTKYGQFSKSQVKSIMRETIPVPGAWLRGVARQDEWSQSPHLRELVVLELADEVGELGSRAVRLAEDLGLYRMEPTP
ncbi:CRISPR-associated helicase Cas3' [Nonomuraea sp. NPDC050663]|uniref:CRISPR-associated helicase Cas3' n=1 Tax=Nonomuraea sp. NPDC050663 TaxID=3364370 RepID=UPI0037A82659